MTQERADTTELDRLLRQMDVPVTFGLSVQKRNQAAKGAADGVPWPHVAAYVGWSPDALLREYQREARAVAALNPHSDLSFLSQFLFGAG
jgi:hypothetical protein